MLEFQLFRIKVYPSKQMFFGGDKKPSGILLETLDSPSLTEFHRGMIWHVGNVSKIDETGLYFRVGKITKAKRGIYQNGNFVDEEFEEAPYTHVVVDIPIEVCAIAKNPKLSQTQRGIANRLARLLSNSDTGRHYEAEFEIDLLKDPEDFVTHLRRAYTISRFWMTFTRPNPFDSERDFTMPFSRLLKEAQAEKGKAQIEGEDLKPQILEGLAHSAAATGNDAVARLQLDEKQKPTTMRLRDNPVFIQADDVADDKQKKTLLDKVRQVYQKVRGKIE